MQFQLRLSETAQRDLRQAAKHGNWERMCMGHKLTVGHVHLELSKPAQ